MTSVNVTRPQTQNGGTSDTKQQIAATREALELAPPVDIYENQEELLLVVDLPGVSPEAIKIDYDSPELRIRAERASNGDRPVAYFRAFRVDERIDPSGIEAELSNGVLSVHLQKSAALKPRRVAVKTN
jgi:HSP20 family molecular chaperone IbpA